MRRVLSTCHPVTDLGSDTALPAMAPEDGEPQALTVAPPAARTSTALTCVQWVGQIPLGLRENERACGLCALGFGVLRAWTRLLG